MEREIEQRNEISGERTVGKPLRGKVQTTDFPTSLGNPQKPRIPTFPTAPTAAGDLLSRRTGEQNNSNPTSSEINLLQRKNGLNDGVHLQARMSLSQLRGPLARFSLVCWKYKTDF
jgi:hypothetical protein